MWVTIMRKLFHTTAALSVLLATSMAANAADVPPYAPPPPVYAPPVYAPLWTGFYLGGNIGGAWANRDVTDTFFAMQASLPPRMACPRFRPSMAEQPLAGSRLLQAAAVS